MRILFSLLALVLAPPVGLFASAILVLDYVIAVRNPFRPFWDFLIAFGWVVPIAALACVLIAAAFFRAGQLVRTVMLVAANIAALMVIMRSEARPAAAAVWLFLLPALLSLAIAGSLLWSHAPAARLPAVTAAAASPSGSGR